MAINYAALKTELQTDPTGLGYAGPLGRGETQVVADLLNAVRQGVSIERETVPAYEVWEAIVPSEWAALTANDRQRVQTILSMGEVSVRGTNTRSSFAAAFGAGTSSRTQLAALQNRPGSRAEQLFGTDVVIQSSDITIALQS